MGNHTGGFVSGCAGTNASLSPGSPSESPTFSPLQGGKYAVAHFHTHTPLTYCPSNVGRDPVGPTGPDESLLTSSNYGIPGLVYDYVGDGGKLYGGHSINANAQVYTFSLNRRATLPY